LSYSAKDQKTNRQSITTANVAEVIIIQNIVSL